MGLRTQSHLVEMGVPNDEALRDAKEWFNNLDSDTKSQFVLVMYKMHMNININKVKDLINRQWMEKFRKLEEEKDQLKAQNDTLREAARDDSNIVTSIKDVRDDIEKRMKKLEDTFTRLNQSSIDYMKEEQERRAAKEEYEYLKNNENIEDDDSYLEDEDADEDDYGDEEVNIELRSINSKRSEATEAPEAPDTDKLLKLCSEEMEKKGKLVKSDVENICLKNNIPISLISQLGGIKAIKKTLE